jgi:hypothetical protein
MRYDVGGGLTPSGHRGGFNLYAENARKHGMTGLMIAHDELRALASGDRDFQPTTGERDFHVYPR